MVRNDIDDDLEAALVRFVDEVFEIPASSRKTD